MSKLQRLEPPKYRAIRFTAIGGIPYKVGEEFEGGGVWPNLAAVEPINGTARKIADYLKRYGASRCFPPRPRSDVFGCYYLPAALSTGSPVHEPSGTRDSYPQHESPRDAPLYIASHRVHFANNVTIAAGKTFAWLRWPREGWRSASPSAVAVVRYLGQWGGKHPHPDLERLIAPYCELHGLFLPPLRPLEKPSTAPAVITDFGILDDTGALT